MNQKAQEYLENEVKIYDYYLRGEMFGYILEEKKLCETCGHMDWEELDNCWGFYGSEYINEIKKQF